MIPSSGAAQLRWARAANSMIEARRAVSHLPADHFSSTELRELRAWFAAHEGRVDEQRTALEKLIELTPGDTQAVDRLAVLAGKSGETGRANELRTRKSAIDQVRARYFRLLEPGKAITDFAKLGGLAETTMTGLRGAWLVVSRIAVPSGCHGNGRDRSARSPAPDPRLPAGGTLAAHLGDSAGLAATDPRPSGEEPERPPLPAGPTAISASAAAKAPEFRDDAAAAGPRFVFDNGRSPLRQLPETTAGGVRSARLRRRRLARRLRRSRGRFPPDPCAATNRGSSVPQPWRRHVRRRHRTSGIARMKRGYGHGVAVGDFDNDGRPDLFITRWRSYALYRNRGDGTFEDVTERAGLGGDRDWPTSAAFADLDNDGDLDLYVCHYLVWDAEHPTLCQTTPSKQASPSIPTIATITACPTRSQPAPIICSATTAAGSSTCPPKPASSTATGAAWGSWPPTSTTMAWSTCSSPTTRRPITSGTTWEG